MSLSPEYKQRLSDWVSAEMERSKLSERALADKLGVSYNAVQKWRKQLVKRSLEDRSITAIARYKGEPPDAVREWLEGSPLPTQNPLIRAVKEASIDDLIEVLSIATKRLEAAIGGLMGLGNSIAELIRLEMKLRGLDPDKDEDFREFARLALAVEEEEFAHLRAILDGKAQPTRDDLPDLATGLRLLTGRSFSVLDLMNLGRENGDRGGLQV